MAEEKYPDKDEGGIYTEEGREELEEEEDELTNLESGFMQGYNEGEKLAKCSLCKKPLAEDFVEEEIDGGLYRFCSDDHAEVFLRNRHESEL